MFTLICLQNCPEGVRRAATWIEPTAQAVKNKLIKWGMPDDGSKIRAAGNSLGSILSGELTNKFDNKGDALIALDPPSENNSGVKSTFEGVVEEFDKKHYCGISLLKEVVIRKFVLPVIVPYHFGNCLYKSLTQDNDAILNQRHKDLGYTKYKVNLNQERGSFSNQADKSRAFYGKFSFAGNRQLASTAHESYQIDYHYGNVYADKGNEHQHVVSTYVRMANQIQLLDEDTKQYRVLHLNDIWTNHNDWIREMGIDKTDTGQIDGNKPDDILSMEVFESDSTGVKLIKRYVIANPNQNFTLY